MKKTFCLASTVLALGACAQTPDVAYTFYPIVSKTTITLTQSIDCNAAKTQLYTVETPQVTTAYTADLAHPYKPFRIKSLNGFFADSDLKVGQTEDGRLVSIDQSTTGQGLAIIKAAVSVAVAAAAAGAGNAGALSVLPECGVIAKAGAGKPITLTYTTFVDFTKPIKANIIKLNRPDGDPSYPPVIVSDGGLHAALFSALPSINIALTEIPLIPPSAQISSDDVTLTLQKTEDIQLQFQHNGTDLADSSVVVPTTHTYLLPIPKAAIFGKQSLSLAVAPSGAIMSIEYGRTTGAADAANALSSVLSGPSTATVDMAADAKAQGDLIAQNSRLVRCKAKPETCT